MAMWASQMKLWLVVMLPFDVAVREWRWSHKYSVDPRFR